MKGKRIVRRKRIPAPKETRHEIPFARTEDAVESVTPPESAASSDSIADMPTIAIVGRPNVGKSSLFNAILGRRQAIVHFDSGVTRDRVCSSGVWEGRRFQLIDTGGLAMYESEMKGVGFWDKQIEEQVDAAIETSSVILFVVDVQAGLNPLDQGIASRIRACGKPVFLVANKADNASDELHADEFHALGFDSVHPVSCLHRRGVHDLMEAVLKDVPPSDAAHQAKAFRIAVLGRPNVGKSSIVNRLLGENRVIVSDVPGTTRDSIDVEFELQCSEESIRAVLVDTAGLRKRSKVDEAVEQYSMMRAEQSLKSCDVVLFVIEASRGEASSQDKTIARMIEESGKGCVIVSNKWDVRLDGMRREDLLAEVRASLPKMLYAPVVFVSALTGFHFKELADAIAQVRAQLAVKVTTAMLNRVIQKATERTLPPVVGIKPLKIYYGTMAGNAPPRFILFVNDPKLCADSYKSYLANCIREAFNMTGLPIVLRLQARSRRDLSEVVHHEGSVRRKPKRHVPAKKRRGRR